MLHLCLSRWLALAAIITPLGVRAQQPAYQIHRDAIRGRVTDDSGKVIVAFCLRSRSSRYAASGTSRRLGVLSVPRVVSTEAAHWPPAGLTAARFPEARRRLGRNGVVLRRDLSHSRAVQSRRLVTP
jgi:hypothetical protein